MPGTNAESSMNPDLVNEKWVDYGNQLNDFTNKIEQITNNLIDNDTNNDIEAKKEWQELIKKFDVSFKEYLKSHQEQMNKFMDALSASIKKIVNKFKISYETIPNDIDSLLSFVENIGNQLESKAASNKDVEGNREIVNNSEIEIDSKLLWLNWDIVGLEVNGETGEKKKTGWRFYSGIDKEVYKSETQVDLIKDNIKNNYINKIEELIEANPNLPEKDNLNKINSLLVNFQNIIENPIESNVNILQQFILDNLDDKDKAGFMKENKYNEATNKFDGKFWISTLKWLNKVLEKIGGYIQLVGEKYQTKNTDEDEKVKPSDDNETKQSLDTKPLELVDKDDSWKINKYQVMGNTKDIAKSTKLNATFYTVDKFQGEEPKNGEWPLANSNNAIEWVYYMSLADSPKEIYEVKVDNLWNLCPVVKNCQSGKRILIKNYPSCIAYLQNKIPPGLPWNPQIFWNPSKEDYVIRSDVTWYKKGLTIEPMEIDWYGLSPDLSEHLIMSNFVNFLRFNKSIDDINFKNNNPDLKLEDGQLYVRVDRKSNRSYDENHNVVKWWKRYKKINMEKFWLDRILDHREEKFRNLIKINNGKDWRDKWDKKKDNKYYGKIDVPWA